jgi:hypothetical protein
MRSTSTTAAPAAVLDRILDALAQDRDLRIAGWARRLRDGEAADSHEVERGVREVRRGDAQPR